MHVAGGWVVHLVGDGHVLEPGRTDPVQAALAFQEQGARWLQLVVAEDGTEGGGLLQARRIIDLMLPELAVGSRGGPDVRVW
ncbi:hypothetical protein [Streptomyces violascens]|uniref:hypothetical protein n=1 Tax=Streptomyces violascens TaxID=67381 RepID=UPI001672EAC6|nr:hypothetical protein [Streptomyces violascens]GGU29938.1 hypothetical protein GCM10010289_59200 [Streptomyces violascens]